MMAFIAFFVVTVAVLALGALIVGALVAIWGLS